MIELTPTQRIEWLGQRPELVCARTQIQDLLKSYERFLELTDASEEELVRRFLDKKQSNEYFESASRFGDLVFQVLEAIGNRNRFHRLLIV